MPESQKINIKAVKTDFMYGNKNNNNNNKNTHTHTFIHIHTDTHRKQQNVSQLQTGMYLIEMK